MFSLYVCDIPQNITKEELEKVFSQFNGFHEVRLAKDKNRQRIAFVDYDTPQAAEYAMSSTIGYRLSNSNKGITVRFSENSKNNQPQPHNGGMPTKRRETSQNSCRGHQPFQSSAQTGSSTVNGVNDGGGSSNAPSVGIGAPQKHRGASGFGGAGGQSGVLPRLNSTSNGTAPGGPPPQQRQSVGTGAGQNHSLFQSGADPAQQMQQRFYPTQAGLSGGLDLQHPPPGQPYIDSFGGAGTQYVNNLSQIGAQQPNPNGQHSANTLFGGGGPGQAPHLGAFSSQMTPGSKPPNQNQPMLVKSPNAFENGGGLRNPEQSIFPQPQHHLAPFEAPSGQQPNQQFAGQHLQIGSASVDLGAGPGLDSRNGKPGDQPQFCGNVTGHQILQPPVTAGLNPQNHLAVNQGQPINQGIEQGLVQAPQAQQPPQPTIGNQPQDCSSTTPPPAGGNSHQDIVNLLSNLNSMASSMASSIVNQQALPQNNKADAPQQFQQQQPLMVPPDITQNPPANTTDQQIQSQLLQSLISTLQSNQPPAESGAPQQPNTAAVPLEQQQIQQQQQNTVRPPMGNWPQAAGNDLAASYATPYPNQPPQSTSVLQQIQQPQTRGSGVLGAPPAAQLSQRVVNQVLPPSQQSHIQQAAQGVNQTNTNNQNTSNNSNNNNHHHGLQQQVQQNMHSSTSGNGNAGGIGSNIINQHQQLHPNNPNNSQSSSLACVAPSNASNQTTAINNNQNKQQSLQKTVVQHIQAMFGQDIFCVPKNATNTIYVEGIPVDATEREVSHIFRPFKGFKSVRLIPREINPDEKVILCFADFENDFQTTLVINTLQGYRFDKDDIWGLQFSYANKQSNSVNSHQQQQQQHSGIKGGESGAKEVAAIASNNNANNPNNNNNNSIANRTVNSGSGAGHSADKASYTSKDGAGKPASLNEAPQSSHSNNNTSKK